MSRFIIAALVLVGTLPQLHAQTKAERTYQATLSERSLDRKQELGRQLGRLGTDEARDLLLRLLDEVSYWNQLAAVDGLLYFPEPAVYQRLVDEMLKNHMVEDEISRGLRDRFSDAFPAMADRYRTEPSQDKREKLIRTISGAKRAEAERFLQDVIADQGSADRKLALKALIKGFPDNDACVRDLVDDPVLRPQALDYVAEKGSATDLPLFTAILDQHTDATEMIIAYQAVAAWGDGSLQEETYRRALAETDEVLARSGMYVFRAVQTDAVRDSLCRLSRRARFQSTRMVAGERLAEFRNDGAVPYLVPLLAEEYVEQKSGLVTAIASILTAGIWGVLEGINESFNKKSFERKRTAVIAGLERITGVSNGTSYAAWRDWALHRGYTIQGANLIQELFSGYPARREAAISAAARLLGYRDRADFVRSAGSAAEPGLQLELARQLTEKGYLKDERF